MLLARLQVGPGWERERLLASVTLDYVDVFAQRPGQAAQDVVARVGDGTGYAPLWDLEVLRNATIQRRCSETTLYSFNDFTRKTHIKTPSYF